jgi:hypothetical protein
MSAFNPMSVSFGSFKVVQKLVFAIAAAVLSLTPMAATAGGTEETNAAQSPDEILAGPAWSDFRLTLEAGRRQEAVGPLYFAAQTDAENGWGIAPLISYTHSPTEDWSEVDFLYPFSTWRRFGSEYRYNFFQLISFSGGKNLDDQKTRRFTLFPLYFQSRSDDPALNYTAVVPFYGHLEGRLFHDDIKFVLFPLYAETRKKEMITDNYLYPIFHLRRGGGVSGWQVWPLVGVEHKIPTTVTNTLGEPEIAGGYDRHFVVWPFYLHDKAGIGSTNQQDRFSLIPFYDRLRSPLRDEDLYGFPFGYWRINDRGEKYEERDFFWPLVEFARGSKNTKRIFPFYSRASREGLDSEYYFWPLYKSLHAITPGLERRHTRVAIFLYSDLREKDRKEGRMMHRVDFWPLYTWQRAMDQKERLQVMALLDPFFTSNSHIARDYSPLYSFWVAEKNPQTGMASQSLLWNLYRHESGPQTKKLSIIFGLFQYQSQPEGARWRICGIPFGKKQTNLNTPARP